MKIKKIISICIVLFLLFIAIFSTTTYSVVVTPELDQGGGSGLGSGSQELAAASSKDGFGIALDAIGKLLGSVVGVFTWPIRLIVIGISVVFTTLSTILGHVGGGADDLIITPFSILFNKVDITSIDFFDFSAKAGFINVFRENVALWYYVLRFIATAILLAILIYIGIRMAISTIAEEKAKYKKMVVDWLVSLALLFLLHYIIVFVIAFNSLLVDMLAQRGKELNFNVLITGLLASSVSPIAGLGGWAATILLGLFTWQTIKFFIMYVKRMITIGFLILISPLITITYSIDRAGDQKAQALNSWLKEFVYNVLIQPFHCVLYLSFAQVAFETVIDHAGYVGVLFESLNPWSDGLGELIFAILCLVFVDSGEKIIREIFGFTKASSVGNLAASAAIAATAFKSTDKIGEIAKGTASMFPQMQAVKDKIANSETAQKVLNSKPFQALSKAGETVHSGIQDLKDGVSSSGDGEPNSLDAAVQASAEGAKSAAGNTDALKQAVGDKISGVKDSIKDAQNKGGNKSSDGGSAEGQSNPNEGADKDNKKKTIKPPSKLKSFAGAVGRDLGHGVGSYWRWTRDKLKDSKTWSTSAGAAAFIAGLGMEGNLGSAALYATAFSKLGGGIGKIAGFNESRTARELTKDLGKNVRSLESVSKKEMTQEEFIEHIKEIEITGSTGDFSPEKIGQMRTALFNTIQKSADGDKMTQNELARGYMAMSNVFDNGGDLYQAVFAMLNEYRNQGHNINPNNQNVIINMVKNIQEHTSNAQIYRAWAEAKKQDVSVEKFTEILMENKAEHVEGGVTDTASVDAYNSLIDSASNANNELKSVITDLARGQKKGSKTPDIDAQALMQMLATMASQIQSYQSTSNPNEVVIKEMVSTYNITAERTNKLDLQFDTSRVKHLDPVRKFVEDGQNPGKYKLEENVQPTSQP